MESLLFVLIVLALLVAYHLEFCFDDEDEDETVHELDVTSNWSASVEMWATT